ncbi:MAG: aminopeptidase [Gemmatimonadales bacterium]
MSGRKRLKMGLLIAAAVLLGGYGTAYVASSQVRYVSGAGLEEIRILSRRVPMNVLAADPRTPSDLRAEAQLVLDVRAFASVNVGLNARETYTTYSDIGRDTLLLVLTASPKNCICPVTWHYPIVGSVPYKGFFKLADAEAAAEKYAAMGYDVNLRPSAAYSTLGWFNDPLLSTAITSDSVELAALVFHEIAHNTLWVKGATAFNESFAQWVAYHSAEIFFASRNDSAMVRLARGRWHDEHVLGDYYAELIGRLDSLYALKLPPAENDAGRAVIARWSRDTLALGYGPQLLTYSIGHATERPINNAALIGVRLYRTNLDLFDAWYAANCNDIGRAVFRLKDLLKGAEGDQAFKRLAAVLHMTPTDSAATGAAGNP